MSLWLKIRSAFTKNTNEDSMAKRTGPPASHLKIMIWEVQVQTYISKGMLEDKNVYGEQQERMIVIHPKCDSISELLDTFCHECLHVILGTDEDLIRICTKKVMHSLTPFERMRLFLKLAQSLKRVDL